MAARKQLIIIPGLGDRGWLYRFIKPLWALFGFDVRIFIFDWNDDRLAFKQAQGRLEAFISSLGGAEVYIIGVSAGGTAAVNALATNPKVVAKVVTVCTPYAPVRHLANKLLIHSINEVPRSLAGMDAKEIARVLSIHGLYDQAVPTSHSRPQGIQAKRLPILGHGPSIAAALSVYGGAIRSFFKN